MKATVDLPDDVFQQAQNQAAARGLNLNQFLSDGLTKLIQAGQPPSPPPSGQRVDFPIIKTKPGCSVITKEMVDLAEEQMLKEEAEHHGKSMRRQRHGNSFSKAEALRIAQALIEATRVDPVGSLTVVASTCSEAKTSVEPARRNLNAWKSGQEPRFTPTQGRYLAFIQRYISKYGVAPAESDIQRHFLVSAPSVNAMMQTLTRRGLISRTPGAARSIRLLVPAEELPKL